jgi:hypothetical protein
MQLDFLLRRLPYLQNVGTSAVCEVASCKKTLQFSDLVAHLKSHLKSGSKINCPAAGCGREMRKVSSFSAHISIKHRTINRLNISKNIICSNEEGDVAEDIIESENDINFTGDVGLVEVVGKEQDVEGPMHLCEVDTELFTLNIAQFLLQLQCRYHIPSSTVDVIAKEFHNIHSMAIEDSMNQLKNELLQSGMNDEKVTAIIRDIQREDKVNSALNVENGQLRSQHNLFVCLFGWPINTYRSLGPTLGVDAF